MKITHSRPSINEDDVQSVVLNLQSGKIATGDEVKLFEKELSDYIGVLGGVAVNSGTNALFLALKALDIKSGDEVILPSYVCASVLSAVNCAGAKPIFADIEKEGYNISPESVAEKITRSTKAIIVPHMFGTPANLEELLKLKIPIIEDCAQSVGGEYKGKKLGSFGILSIFSFYATKVLSTGQGGMVLTNSKELLDKLRDLTEYDERENYVTSYNFSMTDFQAALGRSQLKRLGYFIKKRREIANNYDKILGKTSSEDSIFFRYVIEVDDPNEVIEKMDKLGVKCTKPVFKPLHRYFNISDKDFPNTAKAQSNAVSIPIYPFMTEEEINYLERSLNSILIKPN